MIGGQHNDDSIWRKTVEYPPFPGLYDQALVRTVQYIVGLRLAIFMGGYDKTALNTYNGFFCLVVFVAAPGKIGGAVNTEDPLHFKGKFGFGIINDGETSTLIGVVG